jgi:hypothetical protein
MVRTFDAPRPLVFERGRGGMVKLDIAALESAATG